MCQRAYMSWIVFNRCGVYDPGNVMKRPAAVGRRAPVRNFDLAARWGVRSRHILALARDGGLPHVKLGKYVRFRAESVQRWLDDQEREI